MRAPLFRERGKCSILIGGATSWLAQFALKEELKRGLCRSVTAVDPVRVW